MVLTEGHFVENLEAALDSLDQPTFDGLNAYFMSHAIRAAGFTVALSGTGGDELFGGYTTYRDLPVLQRWSRRAAWMPREPPGGRGRAGDLAAAPLRRSGATADALGQAPRDGPSRRRSAGALPAGLRAVPPRLPARAPGARLRRRRSPTACRRRCVSGSSPRPGPHAALGHQRHGAAAVPGRAAAARQRCGQHGLLARAARAPGGPGPVRERGPPAGSGPLSAAGPQGHAAAHRPARPRPGAVRAAQERVRLAVRSLDPARA